MNKVDVSRIYSKYRYYWSWSNGNCHSKNILKSRFNLVVYNRTIEKTYTLVEAGANSVASPKEAAAKSDVILTSLSDDHALLDVVTSEEGIIIWLETQ